MKTFLNNDSGAVTVDWVVLTAGLAGLGLATLAVVGSGVEDLSTDVDASLSKRIIYTAFGTSTEDFSDGAVGWIGAKASFVNGFGDILGPIGGSGGLESVSKTFDLPEGANEVLINFDLLALDSLDGGPDCSRGWGCNEGPVLFIDGQRVATGVSSGGGVTWTYEDTPGVRVESVAVSQGNNIGAGGWSDGVHQIKVTRDKPGPTIKVGFGLNANQPIHDEAIGIDNFTISTPGLGR
jgi:hypothetical protein